MCDQTNNPINEKVNEMMTLPGIMELIHKTVKINVDNKQTKDVDIYNKFSKVVFDSNSYNFHIFPKDEGICIKLSDEFLELRKVLKEKSFVIDGITYKPSCGNGNIKALKDLERSRLGNSLYKYVCIVYKKAFYTINFMRYSCDKDGKIGCTMRAIQFHKSTFNKGFNLNQSEDKRFQICYPLNDENYIDTNPGGRNAIPNTENTTYTSVCCNPPVEWPNNQPFDINATTYEFDVKKVDEIINQFLEFVRKEGNI